MLSYLLANIICQTFESDVGRSQNRKAEGERKALLIGFRIPINYEKEEGYRQLDLLMYGPMNYVGVYIRERSHVAPLDPNGTSEDETDLAGPYVKTVGDWKCIGYHDSCWRDSIRQFIHERGNSLNAFDSLGKWYTIVDVPTEIAKDPEFGRKRT